MHSPLLSALGYDTAPSFVQAVEAAAFGASPYSHLCRRGRSELGLQGVYFLDSGSSALRTVTPVVAVCFAESEDRAREIHRLVWNQDFVPFLLVESPTSVRLYSGFRYSGFGAGDSEGSDAIQVLRDFNRIREELDGFHARQIDDGTLWSKWGRYVEPLERVDWKLLASLKSLGRSLCSMGLSNSVAHAFIGRYVYLRYLRDRGFLSDRKLEKWEIPRDQVFSRNATLESFASLNARLDDETEGLNGCIFPFPINLIGVEHLQKVAGAFHGDDPRGQLALFDPYDFSFIPVETLSVIYEQFLHEPAESQISNISQGRDKTPGRVEGAYYTPIPLVNFVLAEMDSRQPLKPGMRILDPSCGSGAFLVQAFRLCVERAIKSNGGRALVPSELRGILTSQIFGIDRDPDACRIAEMSLLITLLDYVDPPDLEGRYKTFRLPKLSTANIFEADFFDPSSPWAQTRSQNKPTTNFDWIIGNPPWKELETKPKDARDQHALAWMAAKGSPPTGGHQLAEAFVWKASSALKENGISGLVLPAMTLFKDESRTFRQALFATFDVWRVVNFSNLAYVLFSGRSTVPAMVLFLGNTKPEDRQAKAISTFAPFVVNQEANRPQPSSQLETWNIVVNASDFRDVPLTKAADGDSLTWKLAMWGTYRDEKLLERLANKFSTLGEFCTLNGLRTSEGIQLRDDPAGLVFHTSNGTISVSRIVNGGPAENTAIRENDVIASVNGLSIDSIGIHEGLRMLRGGGGAKLVPSIQRSPTNSAEIHLKFIGEELEHHPDLEGKFMLTLRKLKRAGRLTHFPPNVLKPIPADRCFVRKGRARLPLEASQPPHLIIDVARRFAVYSDEFIAVPARQVGLSSDGKGSEDLLRALAVFCSSDFFRYHQFFLATQWGIEHSIATLSVLRKVPVPPLADLAGRWASFHRRLQENTPIGSEISQVDLDQINQLVFDGLEIRLAERRLIEDFVSVNLLMVQGKVEREAIRAPRPTELLAYIDTLRDQLDSFMSLESDPVSHHIAVLCDGRSAMLEIALRKGPAVPPSIRNSDDLASATLAETRENLLQQHRQWIYLERNLRLYHDGKLYFFKPLQRAHWTRRQAILDAGELIAEALGAGNH
jgi:hypothetical protein